MELQIKSPDKKKELSDESKRFMRVLEVKNYTGYKLSKEVPELTEAKITFIRTGRNKPSSDMIQYLLKKFPDISNVWLLTGEGEMFNDGTKMPEKKLEPQPTATGYYYPDVSASAGLESGMQNEELNKIPINIPNWGNDLSFINVYGDSMYPKYCAGEIIGIKEIEAAMLHFGLAYVVIMENGEVYLKYITAGKNDDYFTLSSENPKNPSREYHLSLIRKIYIVKGVLTKTTM